MKPAALNKLRRTNSDMTAETQASILQATIASLAEHGYAGTTMSGIADRVGVSRAALIYHYASKHALMGAVITAIYEQLADIYKTAAHPSLTPNERLLAVLDASHLFTTNTSQMAQIELLLAARRDPVFRAEVAPLIEARDNAFQVAWHTMTADMGANQDRLDLIRDFAVSVFRGITINRSLNTDTDSFDRQHALLRQLLLEAMAPSPRSGQP